MLYSLPCIEVFYREYKPRLSDDQFTVKTSSTDKPHATVSDRFLCGLAMVMVEMQLFLSPNVSEFPGDQLMH